MIIVSLTTTSSRLDSCARTLQSLLQQAKPPDRIVIVISKEPYLLDEGIRAPPASLTRIANADGRVELRWAANIGPYRKLWPVLEDLSEQDSVITADDDIWYPPDWLRILVDASVRYPRHVIAARVRKKHRNPFGRLTSYMLWPLCSESEILDSDYVVTGGGGALYKKGFVSPSLLKDFAFLSLCPTADDLWISHLLRESGTGVVVVPEACPVTTSEDSRTSLSSTNLARRATGPIGGAFGRTRIRTFGWLGIPICENDFAERRITRYFSRRAPDVP